MKKTTILLVDDHMVLRQVMRALLRTESDLEVVGEAENGWQAVKLAGKLQPDVVVMDIAMPELDGLEATRRIAREAPRARVLILSSYSDDKFVRKSTEAGAAGYLLKQTAAPDFINAVRAAHGGKACFSPSVFKRIFDQTLPAFLNGGRLPNRRNSMALTPRERAVVRLIAEGKRNLQVAAELSISIKTVNRHRQNAMGKLDIHELAGLTRYAVAEGLVASTPV